MNLPSGAWPWVRRGVLAAFLVGVGFLLVRHARNVDWGRVGDSLLGYEPRQIAALAGIALTSHVLYAGFDLLARCHVRHRLGWLRSLTVASVAYAFTLNLGALVGGVAFRYRLYARCGLSGGTVARIYAFVVVTNWSGYVLLLGIVLAAALVEVPESWKLGVFASRWVGAAMVLLAAGYLGLCAFSRKRSWSIRGVTLRLPSSRLAGIQLALSSVNWMLMAALVYLLLRGAVDYPTVLGTLLLAAIAGAVAHIPGGLGVLETVFLVVLSDRIPDYEIVAALLAYRAVYYLAPLMVALVNYARLELTASLSGGASDPAPRSA